ncbi:hypothetical protein [Streptomyces sp. NPDC052496]|uniref:WXG100 family type VII secretion target n=1 Tax=Streptomyces sp. NPDC052496 TaxID=3154951 RepID=UPI00341A98AA
MISPEKIPSYTGNLAELQHEVTRLRQAAREIRGHGHAVHARFQHLDASYKAPEAEQLFATTQAVNDTSGDVAGKLESVADALAGYADEVAVIVQRLESLRQKASAFVASVKDDQDPISGGWRHDQDKVDEHQALLDGVTAAVAAFQQAGVTAADKITALVHGTRWHINDGSPKQKNAYGFSAEQLTEAPKLPWGSPEHYWGTPLGIDYHLQEFGISLWDNAAGSVEGLVNLFSSGEEGDAAREDLGKIAMGLASYAVDPAGDRKDLNPTQRLYAPYRKDAKEFAKSFVAWDDWATNPGKAVGTVFYNGLTLASGPLGAVSKTGAAAGKAGAAARVAGTLAKVGEVMDPIGAAGKTVGVAARALPKLSEVTAGLRAATDAAAAADTPHSVIELGNGAKVRIEDGQFFLSKDGQPNTDPTPHEPPAGQRTPSVDAPRPEQVPSRHELVGAGARAHEGSAHAGENLPPQASHEAPSTGGHSNAVPPPGETPGGTSAVHTHDPGGSGSGADHPSSGSNHDLPHQDGHGHAGEGAHDSHHGDSGDETPSSAENGADGADVHPHPDTPPDPAAPHGADGSENWGTHNGEPVNYLLPPDEKAAKVYARIRATTDDVPKIAENYGIDPAIVERAKQNLFLDKHDVYNGPGPENFKKGVYFAAYDEIADLWTKAEKGTLKGDEGSFRGMIIHEYVEARLLEAGMPFTSGHPSAWAEVRDWGNGHVGAHDVAPISFRGAPLTAKGTLALWPKMGLTPPEVAIADDLSNLDVVVDAAKKGLGLS